MRLLVLFFLLIFHSALFAQAPRLPSYGFSAGSALIQQVESNALVADFNGDGKADIVFAYGSISVLPGNGDGTFGKPIISAVNYADVSWIAAADVNGDGILDIVGRDRYHTLNVYLGHGDGTFSQSATYTVADTQGAPAIPMLADFDGNGKFDLALVNYPSNSFDVMLGNGDGTFRSSVSYPTGSSILFGLVGDFNGDGKPDLLALTGAGFAFLAARGDGTFSAPVASPGISLSHGTAALNAADLNGDGHLDLFATSPTPGAGAPSFVNIFFGKGDGTFTAGVQYDSVSVPALNAYVTATAIADINADGVPDLIVALAGSQFAIEVFPGKSDGTLQRPALYPLSRQADFLAFADFNGDGRLDGVLTSISQAQISTITGQQGPFLQLSVAPVGTLYVNRTAFTIQVSNAADASATTGTVKVTDTSSGYTTLTNLSGSGWTCDAASCSRSDPLFAGQSYPPITANVDPTFQVTAGNSVVTNKALASGSLPMTDAAVTTSIQPYSTRCLYTLDGNHTVQVSSDGGGVPINLGSGGSSPCPYQATPNAIWISSTLNVLPNTTGAVRTATVSLTSPSGWSDSITVQQTTTKCIYPLSKYSAVFDAAGSGPFDALVGSGGPPSCPLSAVSNASWITITHPANPNPSLVSYSVARNATGIDRSGTMTIAAQTFTVYQKSGTNEGLVGSLPHLAVGGGWDTVIQLVNSAATPAWASLAISRDSGSAFPIPTTILGEDFNGEGSFTRGLNPHALLTDASSGAGSIDAQTGSALLSANAGVGGFIRFRYEANGQEAVVPLESRNAPSYTLSFDNTGGIATGAAIENLTSSPIVAGVAMRDDTGAQTGTASIPLPANGHLSFALTDQFPNSAGQTGSVQFTAPAAAQISVLGLRFPASFHFSTIPVVASTDGGGAFAHLAVGGGWSSTFELLNIGATTGQAHLEFYDGGGNALPLPLTFPQSAQSVTTAAVDRALAPGSRLVIKSEGGSAVQAGSAVLTTTGAVSGFVRFRFDPWDQETIVPVDARKAGAYVLVFDQTGSTSTGVAIANLTKAAATIPIVVRDSAGVQLGSGSVALPSHGHSSFAVTDLFPQAAGQQGSIEIDTPAGGQIAALGIRFPNSGSFTSVPVVSLSPL